MKLRHLAPAPLLAVALIACTSSVPSNPNTVVVTAGFDPAAAVLPLPNALALQEWLAPNHPPPANAQQELLAYFAKQGGFPADQVIPLTFPVATVTVNGPNDSTSSTPSIADAALIPCTATRTPANCNLLVFNFSAWQRGASPFPPVAASYSPGTSGGTITATPIMAGAPGGAYWNPGDTYFYALRGGSKGIVTTGGAPLQPSSTTYLLLYGTPSDFVCPSTSPDCPLPLLGAVQAAYRLAPFNVIETQGFPLGETAVMGTFRVTPANTWVVADPVRGIVPLPSNFMMDPATGKVSQAAANALGLPPLSTLDGFSTTALELAQTSGPILASSVATGAYLYKTDGSSAWPVSWVYPQPPPITMDLSTGKPCVPDAQGAYGPTCVSNAIGLAPAVVVPTASGPFTFPPLQERSTYAVFITQGVTDVDGFPLSKTTLGQMLLFTHPLCAPSPACATQPATATSLLPGVSGAQAALLEGMRLQLQVPVLHFLRDHPEFTRDDIVMPYTFRTQSLSSDALQLAAGPYAKKPDGTDFFPDAPLAPQAVAPADMALRWGVPPELVANGISTFIETYVVTFDKLDPATGAFNPIPAAGNAIPVPAIVAIPQTPAPAGGWPLVVFHHGFTRSRGDVLLISSALAGSGMVVASIDMAKHGARSWCSVNTTLTPNVATGCATGVACNTAVFATQAGDPPFAKPGLCAGNQLDLRPLVTGAPWDGGQGSPPTSGEFLVGPNFFRWRDSQRQDILDQSMLVRVMTSANGQLALSGAVGSPIQIDPNRVFYVGQSLGSIAGTVDVAANPRISRAALSVGGATWPDIASTSFSYKPLYEGALAMLGITPGSYENLLFLVAAHWVLDPADPANFAGNLTGAPLPNLLADPTGRTPQDPKEILGQAARCDATVPNYTNQLLYGLVGLGPLDPLENASGNLQWFMTSKSGTCPTDGTAGPGVSHGFLLDWSHPELAITAQSEVASFLLGGPVSPSPVVVPPAP